MTAILSALPPPQTPADSGSLLASGERWQQGLTVKPTLADDLRPLRMLLVLDNLAGHKTAEFVLWLLAHAIMPLYTPLGGSWLNMAESIHRILKRRDLDGQQPHATDEIIAWFEAVAGHRNQTPTPFVCAGKRKRRRDRQRLQPTTRALSRMMYRFSFSRDAERSANPALAYGSRLNKNA